MQMQGQAYALVRDQQAAMNLAANFGGGVNEADGSVLMDPQAAGMVVSLQLALLFGLMLCTPQLGHPALLSHAAPSAGRTMSLSLPSGGPLSLVLHLLHCLCRFGGSMAAFKARSLLNITPAMPDLAGHLAAGSAPPEEGQAVGYIQGHAGGEPGDAGMEGHAQAAMQYYSHDSMQVPHSCHKGFQTMQHALLPLFQGIDLGPCQSQVPSSAIVLSFTSLKGMPLLHVTMLHSSGVLTCAAGPPRP